MVKTNIDKYVARHGRKPRGLGWYSFKMIMILPTGKREVFKLKTYGTLPKARARAWRHAQESLNWNGIKLIEVILLP